VSETTVQTFNVLGVTVSGMNLEIATAAALQACRQRRKGYVCVTGVHGIMEAQDNPDFRRVLNGAWLNTTDGMPLVWLGKREVGAWVKRVYGPDLMLEIFEATRDGSVRHFFYGGAPGVADHLKEVMEQRFPGICVVGTFCPPFRPLNEEEERQLSGQVAAAKPDILWVGLSTPKQENFMANYLPKLDCTLMFGVGAAFDFHSGRVKQAPRWIQQSGFEWLYRLCTEPRRLWKRYCVNNPRFVSRILLQMAGIKNYPIDNPHSSS
jgi:N-acetylglucosaminyldiphosphoundecaprenol N-acetyl-beta-D-mannosaminyltransferase